MYCKNLSIVQYFMDKLSLSGLVWPFYFHSWTPPVYRVIGSKIISVGSISVVGKVLVVIFDFINNSLLYWYPEVVLIGLSLCCVFFWVAGGNRPDPSKSKTLCISSWSFNVSLRNTHSHRKVDPAHIFTSDVSWQNTARSSTHHRTLVIWWWWWWCTQWHTHIKITSFVSICESDAHMISSGIFRIFWLCNKLTS